MDKVVGNRGVAGPFSLVPHLARGRKALGLAAEGAVAYPSARWAVPLGVVNNFVKILAIPPLKAPTAELTGHTLTKLAPSLWIDSLLTTLMACDSRHLAFDL
mmetsp:Transcript_20360/g.33429  ORF Transcript_20360/g.33429 Transcript_20360/m.33429 type:complete len:102 (-) Transcript_20360:373-678(-)